MTAVQGIQSFAIPYPPLPVDLVTFNVAQDAKYVGFAGYIYNRATGVPIPKWEPTFTFRAKDDLALPAMQNYCLLIAERYEAVLKATGEGSLECRELMAHLKIVRQRVTDFRLFRGDHPEVMKNPSSHLVSVTQDSPATGAAEVVATSVTPTYMGVEDDAVYSLERAWRPLSMFPLNDEGSKS